MTLLRRSRYLLPILLLLAAGPAVADALGDIIERGVIRIGVAEFTPWTIKDESGDLSGFEIDVSNKLASDIGVSPQFRIYAWEEIIPALQKGEIDIISGGMAITPQRALQVNFSRPLGTSGVGLALNTQLTKNVRTLAALNQPNVTLAAVSETLADGVSHALFDKAQIKMFDSTAEAEKELLEGRAHGYVASMPEVTFLSLRNKGKVDVPMSAPLVGSSEALAVRKGEQELLNFLNAWVTAHTSDKWLPTTRAYWFDTMDWAEKEATP